MIIRVQESPYWKIFLTSGQAVTRDDVELLRLVQAFALFCRAHLAVREFVGRRALHDALDLWPDFLRHRRLPAYRRLRLNHHLRVIVEDGDDGVLQTIYIADFTVMCELHERAAATTIGCVV